MSPPKIIAINCTLIGGGGRVMLDIAKEARKNSYEYYTFSPEANVTAPKDHFYFSSRYEHKINAEIGQLTGYDNALIIAGTKRFIRNLKEIQPDIIHLHGLHNWYIDYKLLIDYIKQEKIKTIWTQHDCWSFTGKCPHYTIVNCDKWQKGCFDCPQLNEYPKSKLVDNSRRMYNLKKKYFLDFPNLTIVAVSSWLQSQLEQSFLKDYSSVIIENGVATEIFKYKKSELREVYRLNNKFIILAVASGWSKRKGLDDIIGLAKMLNTERRSDFQIVVIGVTDEQRSILQEVNIISFTRTQNVEKLVEWYSSADVLFNPSMEETFGLVTAEAMACGTPVIVYNSTASPELIDGTDCYCVSPHALNDVVSCINKIRINGRQYYQKKCIQKVKNNYNKITQYKKYLDLYQNLF